MVPERRFDSKGDIIASQQRESRTTRADRSERKVVRTLQKTAVVLFVLELAVMRILPLFAFYEDGTISECLVQSFLLAILAVPA
ncbi:MAG: hypothetical protein GY778_05725 [bacterium]|nr:hypothetical protein [bacterium]